MPLKEIWNKISSTESFRPARIAIQPEKTKRSLFQKEGFERHKHYFEVVVNEMYLSYERKWFKTYDPLVFVTSGFLYKGEMVEIPFLVGPQMLKSKMGSEATGMIFDNTLVAGLHPYRGGNFTIHIMLGRMVTNNYLKKVISILEDASGTYPGAFAKAIEPYIKVAKVIIKGLEDLFDSKDIESIMGHSNSFQTSSDNNFKPGFFALINKDENEVNPDEFFVIDKKLHHGSSMETAKPYREEDYVLYSIVSSIERNDIEMLPFYDQFTSLQRIITDMGIQIGDDEKKILNGKLFSLIDSVRMSPDVVREQVEQIIEEFRTDIKKMIDDRRPLAGIKAQPSDQRDEWERKLDAELLSILKNT
jgi:uncharacterized protein YeeX (DUF496 family)